MDRVGPNGKYYPYLPPSSCGTHFYTHESCPDLEFWCPIPMLDKDVESITPPQTQYLFCNTYRTFPFGSFTERQRNGPGLPVCLQEWKGKWTVFLLLHAEADFEALGRRVMEEG
jgi:hypothetical protein